MILQIDGLLVFRFVVITDNLTADVVNSCHSVAGGEITYKLILGMSQKIPRTHLPSVLFLFFAACVIPQFNPIENFVNESEIPEFMIPLPLTLLSNRVGGVPSHQKFKSRSINTGAHKIFLCVIFESLEQTRTTGTDRSMNNDGWMDHSSGVNLHNQETIGSSRLTFSSIHLIRTDGCQPSGKKHKILDRNCKSLDWNYKTLMEI